MGDTSKASVLRSPFGELRPLAAALTLGFGLSLAPTTYAATFTVTNLNDSGAGSLRDAINQANLAIGTDTITFTVTGTIPLASQIVISDSVTITGPGAASLTVSPTGTARVFYINHEITPTVTISGLTIQRTSGITTTDGGAIYNYGGTLTIQNCVISGNQADGDGGAIDNRFGTVNIVNSTLTGNVGNRGGAIFNYDGNINITNSTVSGNTGNQGGAVYNYNGATSVVASTVSGNQAVSGSGGALYARYGSLTVQNSTFSGNTAQYDGGGIFSEYASVTISNSTFTGNSATDGSGGAVALYDTTLNLVSTILANSTESGGTRDIVIFAYYADLAARHNRHAAHGSHKKTMSAPMHHMQQAKTANASHAKALTHANAKPHTAKAHTAGIPHTSGTVNATNSLIENDGGFLNGTDVNNILGQDPALGPLANNGGTTLTHALLAGSPAIDKGSNPNALPFDQRGSPFVRTAGVQTDIGAFEVQGGLPPPPPPPALDIPTLSQWGTVILSGLLGAWAMVTGFGRRRRSGGN